MVVRTLDSQPRALWFNFLKLEQFLVQYFMLMTAMQLDNDQLLKEYSQFEYLYPWCEYRPMHLHLSFLLITHWCDVMPWLLGSHDTLPCVLVNVQHGNKHTFLDVFVMHTNFTKQ